MIHQALDKFNQKFAVRPKYDNFIGGQWVAPVQGQYFSNITPITGKPVGEIARAVQFCSSNAWARAKRVLTGYEAS
jgi:aldehyde dehydrogenase